ncbi:MAG: FtsJ-like methyltransferase [Homavirus sp.]|uniref:FtsJ-like methyltransferase n=1 Tax=Homavirus sp. TaxID=2487769 RepID=A0A3G5A8I1_9VIRU|nr:MAG: FtsJ-like methyltransferase [Homavirus sp.]
MNKPIYRKFINESPDYDNLMKIIDVLPNKEIFYNFNKYDWLNPKNTILFKDSNYREYFVNNYKKRTYNEKPIRCITDYDPFYPQNFFTFWEILHELNYTQRSIKCGFIDSSDSNNNYNCIPLGHIEATIRFFESTSFYEHNIYIRIPLQKMVKYSSDHKFFDVYSNQLTHEFISESVYDSVCDSVCDPVFDSVCDPVFDSVCDSVFDSDKCSKSIINTKLDTNTIKRIYNYYKNKKFNFVIGNCCDIFQNLISLLICDVDGISIIYIKNYIVNDLDYYIDFLKTHFKNTQLYIPLCQHPLIPECYIILTGFKGCDDNLAKQIINMIDNRTLLVQNKNINTLPLSKMRSRYVYNYRENLIKFMNTIEYDNKYTTNEDEFINSGLKWCKKYNMKTKACYYSNEDNFSHIYLKYQFKCKNNKLPTVDDNIHSFRIVKMHQLKRKLNNYKRIIDTKEQFVNNDVENDIIDWNKLTDCVDLYRNLKNILKWKYNSEMTTNAFLKMYEILCNEDIIDKKSDQFKAFHICEAPGAFISSINHYIRSNTVIKNYIWYAQSLNPQSQINIKKYPSLLDDTFGLMRYNRDKWLFGKNNTGDITCNDTIDTYAHDSRLKNIDIITGDGGLQVPSNQFNEQEAFVGRVIFGEIVTILRVLPKNKKCILKCFIPFSETITISTIYLLTLVFAEVNIVKPLTSHPSSSEVYMICNNYIGYDHIPSSIKHNLTYILNNFNINSSIFPEKLIPESFINQLYQCSDMFVSKQIDSICRSLYYRYNYYDNYDNQIMISENREICVDKWLQKCNIVYLDTINKNNKIKLKNDYY